MSCSSCQQNNHISNSTTEDSLCECACGCAEPTCPTPQPCTEITDARCIIYTQAPIKCGNDIVVTTNASASTALTQIITYFCNRISESLIPNDIICNEEVIVDAGSTIQVAIADIISFLCGKFTAIDNDIIQIYNLMVEGAGTNNYLARWTPNGNTLGNSLIQDNGTRLGVGSAPQVNNFLVISSTINEYTLSSTNLFAGSGSGRGLVGYAQGACLGINYGVHGVGQNAANRNVGGYFVASGNNPRSVQLSDGTEGVGKFLKCVDTVGSANWSFITSADVSGIVGGSGNLNYIAKFTPNGTTVGNSLIQDNGTNLSVGTSINAGAKLIIVGNGVGAGAIIDVVTAMNTTSGLTSNVVSGLNGSSTGINTGGFNVGVTGTSSANTASNIGVSGSTAGASVINIGGKFTAVGASNNYSIQLQDNTEAAGKFLKSITSDGKANWATITTADVENLQKEITTTYSLTNADDNYTIFINNGVTPITISLGAITKANFCVGFIQEGTADVTFTGVTNPIGLKSKGQGYQTFIERKLATSTYYLLGNTKV